MGQIICPQCQVTLKVRDGAAGTVKCPRCSAAIALAAEIPVVGEDDVSESRAPRPPLRHAMRERPGAPLSLEPVPVVGDDPPPRRRRREEPRHSSGGATTALIVVGVVGLLLFVLCAGGGLAAYLMFDSGSSAAKQVASAQRQSAGPQFNDNGFGPVPGGPVPGGPPPGFPPPNFPGGIGPGKFPGVGEAKPVKLPELPEQIPIGVAPLAGDTQAIDLPDRVQRVASGGGGRFMVLTFGGEKKVGVLDLNDLKISYVEVPEADGWVAAGMNRFAVFLPKAKKLRRYNLMDRKLEKERDFNPPSEMSSFCMGSASNGPLLVTAGPVMQRECRFLDLETFDPMPFQGKDIFSQPTDACNRYWAAANGRYFGCCWADGDSNGLKLSGMSIEKGIIERIGDHGHTWYCAPFADGKNVATGGSGVLTRDINSTAGAIFSPAGGINLTHMFVPAQSGQFYMHVQIGGDANAGNNGLPTDPGTIVFYKLGDLKPLLTLKNVPVPRNEWPQRQELGNYQSISLPRGVHWSPEAKALAIIAASRDKLYLYRVDVSKK
jgi:hypothetical protein